MADVVPAAHRTRGGGAFDTTPDFVFDVPAAQGAGGATLVPATVAATAAALVGVAAHQSATLACFVAFAASLVPVVRAAWPEHVDADLARLDASLRRCAGLARAAAGAARADLESDMRRLNDMVRGNAVLAAVYGRAEARARAARAAAAGGVARSRRWAEARWAEARWGEHEGAARAACSLLRLVARACYSVAAVLVEEAHNEATIRAPAALGYLRGVAKEMKNQGLAPSSGIAYRDVSYLIRTAVYLAMCIDMAVCTRDDAFGSSLLSRFLRSVASCLAALLVADWVCSQPDGPDETSIAADVLDAGSGEPPTRAAEATVPESWKFLWLLTITAHIVDVYLLRVTLGPRPVAVAFLALCNVKVINAGKKVQLTQDGDADGSDEGAGKWRRVATAVLAASSVKVAAIFVVLGFQMAALSLVSLGVTAVLLLIREENLSDLEASDDDDNGGELSSGLAGNIAGGAEEEADEIRTERSSTIVDDAEAHGDGSEEPVEEQRREEPDSSSSSSISMDGWDFVEMDGFDTPGVADRS